MAADSAFPGKPPPSLWRHSFLVPLVCIPLVWMSFFFSMSVLILVLVPAGMLISRRWVSRICILLVTPVTLYFCLGVSAYLSGTPFLVSPGFPRNPSREYRCRYRHYGDAMQDDAWVITLGNNLGVCTMVRLFGPARGSYTGPYPSPAEAVSALASASRVDVKRLADKNEIVVGSQTVKLTSGAGWLIARDTDWLLPCVRGEGDWQKLEKELGPMQAALYQQTVLIVRVPTGNNVRCPERNPVRLIDITTGRVFAFYSETKSGLLR